MSHMDELLKVPTGLELKVWPFEMTEGLEP